MATAIDDRERAIPLGRLLARTGRLSSPLILVLLGLWLAGLLAFGPALFALVVGLVLGGILAFSRERRLQLLERRLSRFMAGNPLPAAGFDILGGDAFPVMINQVEQSLERMRKRQDELDRAMTALLDAVPDPLILVRSDRRIELGNPAARQLLEQDIAGMPIEMALRDPGLLAAIDDVLGGSDQAEVSLLLAGPPARAFGGQVVPVRWKERRTVLISLRELTEQLMIERMRADFVANASHELRTPLTVLKGFIETLTGAARDDPEAQARFLKTMGSEAERMSRLVNDLLSLSRIEQNEHVPPDDEVDLGQVLGGVLDALKAYASDRRVTIDSDIPKDLPTVSGDFDQLTQLFTNLIDNAIKYGGEDASVQVVVRHEAAMSQGAGPLTGRSAVAVEVIDNGPGIAPEHLPRLTERFFRVDPALSRHLGSTGLGLAIVKHVLRRHRGHLNVESELGKGTAVTIYLLAAL
ncbi:MAG: ATP-binding protein [Geminicoccaceae bacterium]